MAWAERRAPPPTFVLAALFLAALAILAAAAPLVAPFDPVRQDVNAILAPPGRGGHALGTDDLGRDVLSRIIYGSRSALLVGSLSAIGAAVAGGLAGLVSAMGGRFADLLVMTTMDGLLAFPTILAALTVIAVLGFGLTPVTLALAIVYCPIFARLVRTETLIVKTEGYVMASRALGFGAVWVMGRHIVPNILGKVIIQASTVFALAVSVEASLSYLGLGIQPPAASWGLMLKDARNYLSLAPWLSVFPGIAVFLTVLSASALGEGLARSLRTEESRL